jgi:nucleotide-binding universal stress UspA family protein
MARSLIVGYDGCECADAALDTAIELARETGDRIVIGFGYGPGDPGEEYKAHAEEVRKYGERVTGPGFERAQSAGVEVQRELVDERPVPALLALAEKHDARAIVVGTYGERPIKGALLGSTPHKLLHVSERPVIVVPFPDD